MADESDEIVVIGERNESGELIAIHSMTFAEYQGSRFYTPREVDENGPAPSISAPIVVRVKVENAANQARAEEAAAKLVQGIAHVMQELAGADPNAAIDVLGRSYAIGDILADLANTDFTIIDRNDFQNNGVGAASRGVLGQPNSDIINMDALLDGYTNDVWPIEYGLTVLILHEMGHISTIGTAFFRASFDFWRSENPSAPAGEFYTPPTDYSQNLEYFADAFKDQVVAQAGLDAGWDVGGGGVPVEPSQIHQQHIGG
ncbi:hypothetical protein [Sphingopyxis sp. LK2115]|jgi:hypothetical protein|uniref:hypothetical protein n=1 Tax=Sphingopyxis sp. LK2115 TaxID=2744558 RepID=UPI001661072A|nr:hypothetical protein [Sphingopyxis sp. LK2115]